MTDARIEELQRRAAESAAVIPLGGGLPAEAQFPRAALASAFLRAVNLPGSPALQYGWPEGSARLRGFIAGRLRERGADVGPDDVIVTSGAQQAIALSVDLLARARAPVGVGVDEESYPAALDLFRIRGLRPTSGLDAAFFYTMPAVANPRGTALSAAARAELLATGRPIIEDDAYADLRFDGPAGRPLLAEAPDRVFYIGTFSKTLCPGLRVGWLVVPRRFRKRAVRHKHDGDLQPSSLAQLVVERYLAVTDFDARLIRLRRFYRRRAHRLATALAAHLPDWRWRAPEGGFAIWLEAPAAHAERIDEVSFLARAIEHGVVFDPGSTFRAGGAARPLGMRLAFSSASGPDLERGVVRLARAWRATLHGRSGPRKARAATNRVDPSPPGRP